MGLCPLFFRKKFSSSVPESNSSSIFNTNSSRERRSLGAMAAFRILLTYQHSGSQVISRQPRRPVRCEGEAEDHPVSTWVLGLGTLAPTVRLCVGVVYEWLGELPLIEEFMFLEALSLWAVAHLLVTCTIKEKWQRKRDEASQAEGTRSHTESIFPADFIINLYQCGQHQVSLSNPVESLLSFSRPRTLLPRTHHPNETYPWTPSQRISETSSSRYNSNPSSRT